jgi:hypothetical protein
MTFTNFQNNRSSYILRIIVERDHFFNKSREYSCYFPKEGGGLDESNPQEINPLDKPKMPTFGEILDVSATKRTISWEHDDKCFSNCSFHFNITLEYIGHENTSQLVNFTTTTRMNITFYNLIPSQNYRLLVSAVCGNLTLSSDPLQVEFNGTDYETPPPPTTRDPVPPNVDPGRNGQAPRIGVIVGSMVGTIGGVILAIVIVIAIAAAYFCFYKPQTQRKYELKYQNAVEYDGTTPPNVQMFAVFAIRSTKPLKELDGEDYKEIMTIELSRMTDVKGWPCLYI